MSRINTQFQRQARTSYVFGIMAILATTLGNMVLCSDVYAQTSATVAQLDANRSEGKQVLPLLRINTKTHSALVRSLIFTPDGSKLISVGQDKTVRIWNTVTNESKTLRFQIDLGGTGSPRAAVLDKTGRFLAIAVKSDPATITERPDQQKTDDVILFDMNSEKITRIPTELALLPTLSFSPNGRKIAVSGTRQGRFGQVRVFDISGIVDGKEEKAHLLNEFPRGLMEDWVPPTTVEKPPFLTLMDSIAFDPTGTFIAAGNRFGTVRIFDVRSGRIAHLTNPEKKVRELKQDFAPGRQVRSVVWIANAPSKDVTPATAEKPTQTSDSMPSGTILVGVEDQLYAWDIKTEIFTKEAGGNQITCLAATSDGNQIAYGVGGNRGGLGYPVMFWNRAVEPVVAPDTLAIKPEDQLGLNTLMPTKIGEQPAIITAVALDVRTLDSGEKQWRVAGADERGDITLWDAVTKEVISKNETQVIPFRTIRWSVDGKKIGWTTDPGPVTAPSFVGGFDFDAVLPVETPETETWKPSPDNRPRTRYGINEGISRLIINNSPDGSSVEALDYQDKRLRRIPLVKGETALSAVLASPTQAIIGTNNGIALYDLVPEQPRIIRRYIGYEGLPIDLSVAPDGGRFAAAAGDGTIRIWSLKSEGDYPKGIKEKEKKNTTREVTSLLSLFPCADTEWVVWNDQSGYYAASPEGDMRIGWHTNTGANTLATWANADQLHETQFQPNVIREVFLANNLAQGIAQARATMTPILSTVAEIPTVKVVDVVGATFTNDAYVVKEKDITIRAFVAGTDATELAAEIVSGGAARRTKITGQAVTQGEQSIKIEGLHPGLNRIRVQAKSGAHGESLARIISVNYDVPIPKRKPNLYVLGIGISKYNDGRSFGSLNYAGFDASEIVDVFQAQKGTLYEHVDVNLLTDEKTKQADIVDAFSNLSKKVEISDPDFNFTDNPDDLVVVFIASHGDSGNVRVGNEVKKDQFFLVPTDGSFNQNAQNPEFQNVYLWDDLMKNLRGLPARNVVLLIDHCHSGGATEVQQNQYRQDAEKNRIALDLKGSGMETATSRGLSPEQKTRAARNVAARDFPRSNFVTVTATTAAEESWEYSDWKHGAFTYAVLRAIRGEFGTKDSQVRLDRVFPDIFDEVQYLAGSIQKTQTPTKFVPAGAKDNIILTRVRRVGTPPRAETAQTSTP